jgi:hypothetical protein
MEEDRMPKKDSLKNWKGRDVGEDPGKAGKRSSSARSLKVERIGDR